MREEVLHYIWENRLYDALTWEGENVGVVAVGHRNRSDGPDFLEARVRFSHLLWIGAVEIHRRASEWHEHQHDSDPFYDGVVLHVVLEADKKVFDSSGREVPTAVMQISEEMLSQLDKLQMSNQSLRCMPEMMEVEESHLWSLIRPLLHLRFSRKLEELRQRSDTNHLNTIFFHTLMHYLGALKNNEAMEQVARSIGYSFLKKHANDTTALEAMLLGQAGLISNAPRDAYEEMLLSEYLFYRKKFGLSPVDGLSFKHLRVRPSSFPARRLAIVAQIIHREEEILPAITNGDLTTVRRILALPPSEYWQNHIDFGQVSDRRMGGVGAQTVEMLIINAITPTAYHYAAQRGDELGKSKALQWLQELPPEHNSITKLFEQNGLVPQSAADSQALLELYHRFCTPYHCLRCPLSPAIFQALRG